MGHGAWGIEHGAWGKEQWACWRAAGWRRGSPVKRESMEGETLRGGEGDGADLMIWQIQSTALCCHCLLHVLLRYIFFGFHCVQ